MCCSARNASKVPCKRHSLCAVLGAEWLVQLNDLLHLLMVMSPLPLQCHSQKQLPANICVSVSMHLRSAESGQKGTGEYRRVRSGGTKDVMAKSE